MFDLLPNCEVGIGDLNGVAADSFLIQGCAFHAFAGSVEVSGTCREASKMPACSISTGCDYRTGFDASLTQFATWGFIEQGDARLCRIVSNGVAFSECAFVVAATVPVAPAHPDYTEREGRPCFLDEVLKVLVGV